MRRIDRQRKYASGIIAMIFACLCCFILVAAAQAAPRHGRHGHAKHTRHISAPAPRPATISGQMIFTYPVKGSYKYSYGILVVDNNGSSVSSTSPLRFDLDTRGLNNGPHTLLVRIYDDSGLMQEFAPFSVIVANGVSDQPGPIKFAAYPAIPTVANCGPPAIYYGKMKMAFDIPPYFDKDRIMIEIRPLIDISGNYLDWIGKNGSASVNDKFFTFSLLKDQVGVQGKPMQIRRPLVLRKGRVFAPISMWRELFGGAIDYDEKTNAVTLYTLPAPAPAMK